MCVCEDGQSRVYSPGGNRDLSQTAECCGLGQTDKGHKGLAEKIHLTHQDVGGLCISGNLLHEFVLQLQEVKGQDVTHFTFHVDMLQS